jgi:hypothetical protein
MQHKTDNKDGENFQTTNIWTTLHNQSNILIRAIARVAKLKQMLNNLYSPNVPISIKGARQTETITQVLPANLYLLTDHCG